MNTLYICIHLMMRCSGARLISSLVEAKFIIEPNFTDDSVYGGQGGVSTIFSAKLKHRSFNKTKANEFIIELLEELEIPYFGMVTSDGQFNNLSSGKMPKKKTPTKNKEPFPINGKVILFPERKPE